MQLELQSSKSIQPYDAADSSISVRGGGGKPKAKATSFDRAFKIDVMTEGDFSQSNFSRRLASLVTQHEIVS